MRFVSRALLVVVLLFCGGAAASAAPAAPGRPPKLIVILVVDQMRGDYIDRYAFQWTGGLHRLITEGAWFRRAAYPYLTTVTCVGHATISTGTFPRTHGMVGNGWFDRDLGRSVRCSEDPAATTISYGDPITGGDSPHRLLVPALSDELRSQLPGPTRVVTFSMKQRTAIMLAGRRADAVTWFSPAARGFATSSVYTKAAVPFIADALKARPVSMDFGASWTRLLPAERYLFDDNGLGEKSSVGWTAEFPHVIKGSGDQTDPSFYTAWETSPFSDAYLGRLAMASIDALKLGRGRGTDFLGISFTALDSVGHDFGPQSHEVQDVLARLDQTVGQLLTYLDRTVGAGNYVVALGGDHGVSPIPEQVAAQDLSGGRLAIASVVQGAQKALEAALGSGSYPVRLSNSDLYLDPATVDRLRRDPLALENVLRAARAIPGVADAYFGEALDSHAAAGDHAARAALMGYYPGRSGDLIVVPKPYWFYVGTDGGDAASHGTLYDYDQHVPVILFGQGIKRGEYLRAVTPADIAPTLAFLAGVTLPQPDGDVLIEAIAPAATQAPAHAPAPAPARTAAPGSVPVIR
jgi:predicted AlkP superfamily pyrophosphatase or phosphodiesterase